MMGQEDLFTRAIFETQLKNLETQYELMLSIGIPEETRVYLGMMGFRIVINVHGEIIDLQQPGSAPPPGEEE
jgi:hypothetical protein